MRFNFNFLVILFICLQFHKFVSCKNQNFAPDPNVELPSGMIICQRYASDRDSCIKKSITNLLPILKNGFAPLGIQPIEPYVSELIHFKYNQRAIKMNMRVRNATTRGLSNSRIRGVRSEVTDKDIKIIVSVEHPKVSVESSFQGQASLNDFKVDSAGYQNVTVTDVRAVWRILGTVQTVNGEDYMVIKDVDVKPRIGNMKYYATGLFPDPDLNQFTVEFINQNWQYLVEQFFPVTKQAWEPIMLELTNNIFGKVPYNRLLPKDEVKQ